MAGYTYDKRKKNGYVVFKGTIPGIYLTWAEVELQVKGVRGNKHRGYLTLEEAQAAWDTYLDTGEIT